MNFVKARINMVEQQIRTWDVLDQTVLDLLSSVPREDFVPKEFSQVAYSDTAIPLSNNQCMFPPREDARILQSLKLEITDSVLEIGTGTGFLTILLAQLSAHVLTVDIFPEFTDLAKKNLAKCEIRNVTFDTCDASQKLNQVALYNAICITGSLPEKPEYYLKQLHMGGRLFAIIGNAPVMQATCFTRINDNQWQTEVLYETVRPRLINVDKPRPFEF